jgi:hypothetical protein
MDNFDALQLNLLSFVFSTTNYNDIYYVSLLHSIIPRIPYKLPSEIAEEHGAKAKVIEFLKANEQAKPYYVTNEQKRGEYSGVKVKYMENDVIQELISLTEPIALAKINYIKGLLTELNLLNLEVTDPLNSLYRFYITCNHSGIIYDGPDYNISIKYTGFFLPGTDTCNPVNRLQITTNLIHDLRDEITARLDYIEKFKIAVIRAYNPNQSLSINSSLDADFKSHLFERGFNQELLPGELPIRDWELINLKTLYEFNRSFRQDESIKSEHNQNSTTVNHNILTLSDILIEEKKHIYSKLLTHYTTTDKPAIFHGMLEALEYTKCLTVNKISDKNHDWWISVLNNTFNKKLKRQSVFASHRANSKKEEQQKIIESFF